MIDRDTFLRVKDWFIICLQLNKNDLAFEEDLLNRKFNFAKELIEFLDEINNNQYVQRQDVIYNRDFWECNALESILEEAKKLKVFKKLSRDTSNQYRYELVQELIKKMKIWPPYCMLVCNFLANSKPTNTPEKYTNLRILCKYWIDCQKALGNNCRLDWQLSYCFC